MNTITQSQQVNVSARTENAVNTQEQARTISDFWENAESNRFGIIFVHEQGHDMPSFIEKL